MAADERPRLRTALWLNRIAVTGPLLLCVLGFFIVLDLELDFLDGIDLGRTILLALLLYASFHAIRALVLVSTSKLNHWTASNFTPDSSLNRYTEARPRAHFGHEKRDHAVLLLHGFTMSAMDWTQMGDELERVGIDHYAPTIIGFGNIQPSLALATGTSDWFRQVVDAYDLLAKSHERVSVIGHSLGGTLAAFVATRRPVDHLVLAAPAIFPRSHPYSRIARHRLLAAAVTWLVPFFPKPSRGGRDGPVDTIDAEASYHYFSYMAVPTRCLMTMLSAQQQIDLSKIEAGRVTLAWGEQDITIDNEAVGRELREAGVEFDTLSFPESAHNIFQDLEHDEVTRQVIEILRSDTARTTQPAAAASR